MFLWFLCIKIPLKPESKLPSEIPEPHMRLFEEFIDAQVDLDYMQTCNSLIKCRLKNIELLSMRFTRRRRLKNFQMGGGGATEKTKTEK